MQLNSYPKFNLYRNKSRQDTNAVSFHNKILAYFAEIWFLNT